MNVPPLILRARRRYFDRVLLTVRSEGLESPACGLIPWSAIRSLPAVNGLYGRGLQIDVFDQQSYVNRMDSRILRLLGRFNLLTGHPLLELPEKVVGMSPEAIRAEIESRAGRTFPH